MLACPLRDARREHHSHRLPKKCQRRDVVGIKNSIYSTELTSCGSQLSYFVRKTLDLDKLVSPEVNMYTLEYRIHLMLNKNDLGGTFLVVQWLRLHLPMQGVQVQSLVRELRSHMPCNQKTKYKTKQCCNKFSEDFKNGLHSKKKEKNDLSYA